MALFYSRIANCARNIFKNVDQGVEETKEGRPRQLSDNHEKDENKALFFALERQMGDSLKMKKAILNVNFLLRFYRDDISEQSLNAEGMIQAAKAGELLLATDLVVICAMVWVMDSFWRLLPIFWL